MAASGMVRVLVIDDEKRYRRLIAANFHMEGYKVIEASGVKEAMQLLGTFEPDVVVLDLRLPDGDGLALCQQIRAVSDAPIIVLTAMDSEEYLIRAFQLGADDYMVKPFSPMELKVRVQALLRRSRAMGETAPEIRCGDLRLETDSRQLIIGERHVRLTPTEWRLMREFMTHCGQVLTHEYLLGHIWGFEHLEEHEYLRVYVRNLRRHIEPNPKSPIYLISFVGVGYALYSSPQGD